MNSFINYFKGVYLELRKVSWPTRKEVINHTIVVLVSATLAIAITASIDFGLTKLVQFIIENKK